MTTLGSRASSVLRRLTACGFAIALIAATADLAFAQPCGNGTVQPSQGEQCDDGAANASAGQVALDPVQLSAASHAPAAERQTVPAGAKPPPQVDEDPVHVVAAAHGPALHAVPAVLN